jgi:hypothetical protein
VYVPSPLLTSSADGYAAQDTMYSHVPFRRLLLLAIPRLLAVPGLDAHSRRSQDIAYHCVPNVNYPYLLLFGHRPREVS